MALAKRRSSVVVYTQWAMLRCYLDSSVPSTPARAGPAYMKLAGEAD